MRRGAVIGSMTGMLGVMIGPAILAAASETSAKPAPHPGYQVLVRSCFKCHGEEPRQGKLDLRTRETALKGGGRGQDLLPGKPDESFLLQMVAGKVKPQMPTTGALPAADVAALRKWIADGAPYPADSGLADGKWWAFKPVVAQTPPAIKDPWIKNPVDAFLLSRMKEQGIRPSPAADRVTLIRRATFDLTGLAPTPEEVDAFVNDRSPNAWKKVVDRLLASPRYGERWARHWLDLARYAESEGFKADETRPNAWRYRDYVIESFNADKPYDRFLKEQIAGDELYPGDPQALVATGFNRHWADESNARNIALRRQEILNDVTDTVGSVVLGLTMGCARCHDHKYDPISQKDYYRLQAFFAALQPRDDLALVPPDKAAEHARQMADWEAKTQATRDEIAALEAPYRAKLMKGKRMPFPDNVQIAIDTPDAQRTPLQWQLFRKVSPQLEISQDDLAKAMKPEDKTRYEALLARLSKEAPRPQELPVGLGVTDIGPTAPKVFTLRVGVYDSPIEEVQPGFPSACGAADPVIQQPSGMASTGRRTALAAWLTDPSNPLTARVMVNRLWQNHFGKGLVPTSSDFGKAGEGVTHPELLDWLAGELVSHGWSVKQMHRLLMTSAAYQQSSAFNAANAAKDPDDRFLWRYRRWRLEGEAVRDAALECSGELNPKMGGPSIFPELPEGVSTRGGWPITKDEAERNRRSVYVFVRRNMRYPLFEAFDFPDTHEPCARRSVTNTAPQALMLFNSDLALKPAQAMAGRLLREAATTEARVERAYRLAFSRGPETAERDLSLQFLKNQLELIRKRLDRKEPVALPKNAPDGVDPAEAAAWVDFCHALINANEFLYVD